MVDIEKQLHDARQRLLDITMRNRLLNFRPTKTRTIRVIDEIPTELYDILVLQERNMEFLPKREGAQANQDFDTSDQNDSGGLDDSVSDLTEEEASTLWNLPPPDAEVDERHTDRFLQTALQTEALQKRLFYINQSSRSILEELGYSTLYLAMGFLEWFESPDSQQTKLAPLILVPVELERAAVRSSFKIQWNGDDISTNISLQWMLQNRFGLSIPDLDIPDRKSGIDKYFNEIAEAVKENPQWRLISDIYLSFFSFTKFTMYKDLDPNAWPEGKSPADHPLIKAILDPSSSPASEGGFAEDDVDRKLDFRELFHVMDADSSQVAVIEDAKAGRNLVVEGPPGTGKSQTIVNIIAELIATGKSVLFVSEKMAALEVVKKRLDQVGLGDYCLELHSRKAKRKEVVRELERTISSLHPKSVSVDEAFDQLETLREDLNRYAEALGNRFGKLDLSPFDLFEVKERAHCHFAVEGRTVPRIRLSNVDRCTQKQYNQAKWKLNDLQAALSLVIPLVSHPWRGCNPGTVLPTDVEEIEQWIDEASFALRKLAKTVEELASISGISQPCTLRDLPKAYDTARFIAKTIPIDCDALLSSKWDNVEKYARPLILEIEMFQDYSSHISTRMTEPAFEIDAASVCQDFKTVSDELINLKLLESERWCLELSPSDIDALRELIRECRRAFAVLNKSASRLTDICATAPATTMRELSQVSQAAECVACSMPIDKKVLIESHWDSAQRGAGILVNHVRTFQELRTAILSKFIERVMDLDIDSVLKEYEVRSSKISLLRLFDNRYRYLKQKILGLYHGEPPSETRQIITDLENISKCQHLREKIREKQELGQNLFGFHWHAEDSDTQGLDDIAQWIPRFRQLVSQGVLTDQAIDKVSAGISKEQIEKAIAEMNSASEWFTSGRHALYLRIDQTSLTVFGTGDDDVPLSDLSSLLDQWDSKLSRLEVWAQTVSVLYSQLASRPISEMIDDLEAICRWQDLRQRIRAKQELGQTLFSSYWHAEDSDAELLGSLVTWIPTFRELLQEGKLSERAVKIVYDGASTAQIEGTLEKLGEAERLFIDRMGLITERIGTTKEMIFDTDPEEASFSQLLSRLDSLRKELPVLQPWAQFLHLRETCLGTVAKPVVEAIEDHDLGPTDIIPCFEGNFADDVLGLVFREQPALAEFVANVHESKIHRFRILDRQLIEWNRQRLLPRLYDNRPKMHYGASEGSQVGFVLSEIKRKRRHKPIRQLMAIAGGLIQRIKPCFMMSPLSIAQFLNPHTAPFDVIVFDEASQVKPEDALGALLRGNQVIVMGDTHQLPPTSFFDSDEYADDLEDEDMLASITDVESILHQCNLSFPTKLLRWHYRSRHESLIAVSNQEFYDNRLLVYPSPIDTAPYLGLKFIHLSDAPYDRGRTAANRKEARAVINAAFKHYQTYPDKSLGVGTFNIRQQQALLEELELQLRMHPEMESHFRSDQPEHFFVKNLETIQGDERDVIFVSIGFGFDQHGRLHRTFGPINQDGGERRLNVLMTRAREACVIFSNFHASDLRIGPDEKAGLRVLKLFLDFAENKILGDLDTYLEDTDSPFEDSVYNTLRGYGYEVRKQVGCAGFRVDLAVVDPDFPGRYLLGIECDGAKYHSSPVARDRDRLRQQILEDKGWRIHRIWSTDWYRNRKDAVENLRSVVKSAKLQPEVEQAPQLDAAVPSLEDECYDADEGDDGAIHALPENELDSIIPDYEICSSLAMPIYGDIHEYAQSNLARIVEYIVDFEGPLHISEVVRRIRTIWGLKRSGQRITDAIHRAASMAEQLEMVERRGDFLWSMINREVPVRRRGSSSLSNIDLVCDEEITEAVRIILRYQFATLPEDLVRQASRVLGILATSEKTSNRISTVIRQLIIDGELQEMPNGMLDIVRKD